MRVDGSIKTVTAGVTSLDDKRHNGTYAKIVDNFRCDPMNGLVKRPATHYIGPIGSLWSPDTNALFSTIIEDVLYWVMIIPFQGPGTAHQIRVFDEFGEEHDVINLPAPSRYFNTLTGNDSVAHTTIGNNVYIANKNEVIEKVDREEEWTKNSMLVIKQAPASFSKIEVIWTGSNHVQQTVEHPVPDWITGQDDVGTNTTAAEIHALIVPLLATGDNAYVQGSTVLIERADGEYASLSATDGANDAVAATLNAETQDINNLPKYAAHNSVVKVRPDKTSDRGQFWMRATAFIETDDSASYVQKKLDEGLLQDAVITVGENVIDALTLHYKGFQRLASSENPILFPPFGALAPTTTPAGDVINYLGTISSTNSPEVGIFSITLDSFPATPLDYITIVDNTSGALIYESALDHDPEDTSTYQGLNNINPRDLVVGETYDVYYEKLKDFFGKLPEVEWNECADPSLLNYLDNNTMPHVLGFNSDGSFTTGPQSEIGLRNIHTPRARQAGDDETNPFPEWIESTVNDIGKFQDRLVILSGDSVSMSQTDKQHAWFRDTVTQQLATDPIGVRSTAQNTLTLNHIVSHNNDALIFSKNAQYKLIGSEGMTSQNAALPQTTSYDNTGTAKPVSNASDVFFPIAYSALFAGLSRFSVDKVSDNQDIALAVTNHVQELLIGDIKSITASSVMGMVFVVTDINPNILYVYEYVDNRRDPQTAWSRWILPEDTKIQEVAFKEEKIQLLVLSEINTAQLLEMRINESLNIHMPRVTYLDYLFTQETVNTQINIPSGFPFNESSQLKVYQGNDAPDPGAEIEGFTINWPDIDLPIDLLGGSAAVGIPYRSTFMPSRRWIRDDSGTPQSAAHLRITDYNFHAVGDEIHVDILNAPNTWPTQTFTSNDPDNDAEHRVSFKQRHDEADIEIWTENAFNTEIVQIEWRGTYIKVGRRF